MYLGSMAAYISEYASIAYISTKGALECESFPLGAGFLWITKTDYVSIVTGFIDCVAKDVSLFNIKCMLAIFGEFRTNIFSETNLAFPPTTINEYAGIQAAVKEGLKNADRAQPGDPNKAAELLVDGVKGQGGAEGRAMPTRLIVGADAFQAIRNKSQMLLKLCDEWEEFGTKTNLDGAAGGGFVGSVQ